MTVPEPSDLRRLIEMLAVPAQHAISMELLENIHNLDPEKPLSFPVIQMINGLRRIVYATEEFQQTGLFEFDLGVIYLESGRYMDAEETFETAQRQWSLIDDTPLICLALFGQGIAWHRASEFDRAIKQYLQVKQSCLKEEAGASATAMMGRSEEVARYFAELAALVEAAQLEASESMMRAYRARMLPEITVEPPIIDDDLVNDSE